ncbi:cryptochrome/photolyase family protein [Endozoicomonas sp. Mp262]|uniref:cryptochrome/photolyase family protein n=1 Tax=Endozoicomonas sp. Mp262 TaxID=2919499 RepID=UPI0021D918AE
MKNYKTLRLILGDQLNASHSWFSKKDKRCLYLVAELKQETDYVCHHIQKICSFFLAMKQFADALAKSGHHVHHMTLDDTAAFKDLPELIQHFVAKYGVARFEYQHPDEYRLKTQLEQLTLGKDVTVTACDTEHFLVPFSELAHYFPAGKPGRMESFYRKMRKRFDILIEDGKPVGERWNFDADNRQKLKADALEDIPEPLLFTNKVKEVLERVHRHHIRSFGHTAESILWPVTRKQGLQLLQYFCQHCLPCFGRYQDAMTGNSRHQWSLYHSRLSFALNTKMLHPMQVIQAVLSAWQSSKETISLAQVEGFIRQILGWREYIRGVYWSNMPAYSNCNALQASGDLPDFFWTGNTRMACMKQAISQSLEFAYAHHIQRLMVTGNYCLLAGINPDQVDQWYLGIYVDAIEWVELPNTRGMSQFADGGLVASKPYAASGNYINKMSDYCSGCYYQVKDKTSAKSCPLNSLYWHFMSLHRKRLEKNPRVALVYKNWDKLGKDEKSAILKRARWCLANQNSL